MDDFVFDNYYDALLQITQEFRDMILVHETMLAMRKSMVQAHIYPRFVSSDLVAEYFYTVSRWTILSELYLSAKVFQMLRMLGIVPGSTGWRHSKNSKDLNNLAVSDLLICTNPGSKDWRETWYMENQDTFGVRIEGLGDISNPYRVVDDANLYLNGPHWSVLRRLSMWFLEEAVRRIEHGDV